MPTPIVPVAGPDGLEDIREPETTSPSHLSSPPPPNPIEDSPDATPLETKTKKIDTIDKKVNEHLNTKLTKMNNGSPDGKCSPLDSNYRQINICNNHIKSFSPLLRKLRSDENRSQITSHTALLKTPSSPR